MLICTDFIYFIIFHSCLSSFFWHIGRAFVGDRNEIAISFHCCAFVRVHIYDCVISTYEWRSIHNYSHGESGRGFGDSMKIDEFLPQIKFSNHHKIDVQHFFSHSNIDTVPWHTNK